MALKGIVEGNNYTFSAASKTITFSNDYLGMSLSDITYITNIKNGVATVIYDPFDPTKGGDFSGLTLTLAFNTTTMSDGDPLQIIVGYTPKNGDPLLVKPIDTTNTTEQTQLLQNISDNLDLLSKTVDRAEGIEVNTRDANPARRDINNATVLSDGIQFSQIFTATGNGNTIDTIGYSAVSVALTVGAATTAYQFQFSHDNVNWSGSNAINFFRVSGNSWTTSVSVSNTTELVIMPAYARYVRIQITSGPTGAIPASVIFTLRNGFVPITVPGGTGTTTVANSVNFGNSTTAALGGSLGGSISVGGTHVPTTNQAGAATGLATTVPWPIGTAGREWPYVGANAGVFRYVTLDHRGRYILGGDTAFSTPNIGGFQEQSSAGTTRGVGGIPNNLRGAQSLTVADVSQDFGDTQVMLLRQILTELKILNQQFHEMPNLLNQANFTMSDPQEYRNDGDFDSSIQ